MNPQYVLRGPIRDNDVPPFMRKPVSAVDALRIADALQMELEAREPFLESCHVLAAGTGNQPRPEDTRQLRRTAGRWAKKVRIVANLAGIPAPKG